MKKTVLGSLVIGMMAVSLGVFIFFTTPANTLTMDVNPSIEITTNRLNNVLSVEPINQDAKDFLENFKIRDKNLENVVNDLVDRMILTGYISGGKDNLVMLAVKDDNADPLLLDKVNTLIAAFLENKQIEAKVFNQTIAQNDANKNIASDYEISEGKLELMNKIVDKDDKVTIELLTSASLQTLIDKALIGHDEAIRIALEKSGGGTVVEFELEQDDSRYEYEIKIIKDGMEYEVEIDAMTGEVLKFEADDDDYDDEDSITIPTDELIGMDEAIRIALAKSVGGTVVKFELDLDDSRYEYKIEIIKNGMEYEVEIDAMSGKVLKFEADDDDDYD
ncbi:MAG: PepSY domain-containing protein, partial [Dethiosulfatibacter sp.]|nr:PepSY domain-containing protein [Dethiosulfatibacter sp.]